jgi:hypothetical protein
MTSLRKDLPVTALDMATRLPNIEKLRQRCQAVAMLDAILSPFWDNRYFSYTHDWGGGSCAQIRNGSGDDCFITFTPAGAFIRGFDHESSMTPWRTDPPQLWPGLVDNVPEAFAESLSEPAFALDGVFAATYCLWRQRNDGEWKTGPIDYAQFDGRPDPDGADQFLELLTDPTPQSYVDFALAYFEVQIDPRAVAHVYELNPLTEQLVRTLNPEVGLGDIAEDVDTSRYPV